MNDVVLIILFIEFLDFLIVNSSRAAAMVADSPKHYADFGIRVLVHPPLNLLVGFSSV